MRRLRRQRRGGSDSNGTAVYDQDSNYVFLNENKRGVYSSDPMEPSASISRFDPSHQGRAPYWSPDGSRIVFESNRAGGYALYLANPKTGKPPRQLTDPLYGAQHGKFFPSGTKLVFTALQEPSASGEGPRGIATIEISDYHR